VTAQRRVLRRQARGLAPRLAPPVPQPVARAPPSPVMTQTTKELILVGIGFLGGLGGHAVGPDVRSHAPPRVAAAVITIQVVRAAWDTWKKKRLEPPRSMLCGPAGLKMLLDEAGPELERFEDTHLYFRKVTQVVMFTNEDIAVMPEHDRQLFEGGGIVLQ